MSVASVPQPDRNNWLYPDQPSHSATGDDRSSRPPPLAADATARAPASEPRRGGPSDVIRRSRANAAAVQRAGGTAAGATSGADAGRRPRSAADQPANGGDERERFYDMAQRVVAAMPDLTQMARSLAAQHLYERTGERLDPDATWLHHFDSAESSATSFNGWEHTGRPRYSETLTSAWMNNFDASWQDQTASDVNQQAGVYSAGPEAGRYGAHNEVRYLASDLRNDIWNDDLQSKIGAAQAQFWAAHEQDWRAIAKGEFIGQARRAYEAGALSENGYALAMKGAAPDVGLYAPVGVDQLKHKAAPDASVDAYRLDVNGYASSDIVVFAGKDGRHVMYLPGEQQPFHEFSDDARMKQWVIDEAKQPAAREALERHFSLYDRQDGVFYTGVDNGLDKLASGRWDEDDIDVSANRTRIGGDVFDDLARRTKERDASDADTLIRSNAEVRAELWKNYLQAANSTVGVIAGAAGGPIGGLLAAGAFGAQLGVEGYDATHGDTQQQRDAALAALGGDVATALLFGGLAGSAVKRPAAPADANAQPWFWPPRSLGDGRTGYLAGPTRGAKAPRIEPQPSAQPAPPADPAQPGPSGMQAPTRSPGTEPSTGSTSTDSSVQYRYSTPSSPDASLTLPPLRSLRPIREHRFLPAERADELALEAMEQVAGANNVRRYRGINELTADARMPAHGIDRVRNSFDEASVDLENAMRQLDDPHARAAVDEYIRNALHVRRPDVIEAVRERLHESAQRMQEVIDGHIQSGLSRIEFFERIDPRYGNDRKMLGNHATLGFGNFSDPRQRIILNLERLHETFDAVPPAQMTTSSDRPLTETIEHEASHLAVRTRDYSYTGSTDNLEQLVNARDAFDQFSEQLAGWERGDPVITLARPELLTERMLGTKDSVSAAERHAVAQKFRSDEMERADILVSHADFLTLMLRDIGRNRRYDAYTN